MGTKYTTESLSGYNSSPPVDDGTASEANKVKWSTTKEKLADPLKDQVANIDAKLVLMADIGPDAKTSAYTTVAGDHQKTIEISTAAITVTLLAIASAPTGYTVTIKNSSGGDITVDATGSETIDGSATSVTLADNETYVVQLNQAGTGYISLQQVSFTGLAGLSSANTFTNVQTYTNSTPFIFEGATADDFETSITVTDPTADNTQTLPDKSGTFAMLDDTAKLTSITATAAANALTLGLAADALAFRSATLTDGSPTKITFTALSLVVPSGATLGTVDTILSRLVLVAINNAGTVELAVVNQSGGNDLSETGVISTTAIDATADSANVFYSTTARTNVAYRVVGIVESTQATAGTWATSPTLIQGAGGNALTAMSSLGYGQTWQSVTRTSGVNYYNTTGKPIYLYVRGTSSTTLSTVTIGSTTVTAFVNAASATAASYIIPPNVLYKIVVTAGSVVVHELR